MNLSNGACGPEGCAQMGTTDGGFGRFVLVVTSTVVVSLVSCIAFLYWLLKARKEQSTNT